MEQIHGVDVSWMTHGNPKDKVTKAARQRSLSQQARDSPSPAASADTSTTYTTTAASSDPQTGSSPSPTLAKPIPTKQSTPTRPSLMRTSSEEKRSSPPVVASPQRRGSWFSNISSKFSSSDRVQIPPQASNTSPKPAELSIPKANPAKNAVLQHASKHEGEGPYTPAPPRSSQAGILHVLRRLSSSNGNLTTNVKPHNHGLVERRVLNVDRHRERCKISGLNQAKLRRVAFCVDVEIAPMPKYAEDTCGNKSTDPDKTDKDQKKRIKERGEGEALKNPKAVESQKEEDGEIKATGEEVPKEPTTEDTDAQQIASPADSKQAASSQISKDKSASDTKKKEKKKKSEEERKARKEKKRKQAEANGTIPMEIHMDSDSSSSMPVARPETPKAQMAPTTNPVRIYRRCCQLRETPILKKITEQLVDPANASDEPGMIERLDLTGYWMQLGDLITLGDYLAIVPVKEVILENCGLSDEGLRVILAGLLAAKKVAGKRRRPVTEPDGLTHQGGVVERLVLRNNKLGPEGWRYLCLFLYLCRTVKTIDLSGIPFPQPPASKTGQNGQANGAGKSMELCQLLSKSLAERLGGSTLGVLSLGEAGFTTAQLGLVIDGVINCGIRRLGLAHNNIQGEGLNHVVRLLRSGICEGLDLGGNDMRDQLAVLAEALQDESCPLWALSLADSNLVPSSLCKLLPTLVKLKHFRFIDLSHNHELFSSTPSAISVLRRYLPKMECLKRIHFADCGLSTEQVIALAEILPEIPGLAHVSFEENPQVVAVATNANTEETKEEACALFASLLAAARVSESLVAVDIEVPSEQSSDLVKAMAKQVVAYCLRNMERLPVHDVAALTSTTSHDALSSSWTAAEPQYPDALQRLVGHDITLPYDELDADLDTAPDDDYVIGGTGVVKALACCLKNRGDESRRQSGEFIRDVENGVSAPRPTVPSGKAKETSKHLLLSARKIRRRLQPAIVKAKAVSNQESHAYRRLIFLDNTLKGIIKRFEDEFPDTRESADSVIGFSSSTSDEEDATDDKQLAALSSSVDADTEFLAEAEDDPETTGFGIRSPLQRSDSSLSLSSKALTHEEGRVLRAGHKFRAGIVKPEYYPLLSGVELVGADPKHSKMLLDMLDELGDEGLIAEARTKGVVKVFLERREEILKLLRDTDPAHWDNFVESQVMARANASASAAAQTTMEQETAVED